MYAHLDLIGGLAGDMFLAAAIDAGIVHLDQLTSALRTLGLGDNINIRVEKTRRGALAGTHVSFSDWDPAADADHRHLSTILKLIDDSALPESVKARASTLFRRLGAAEARAHGIPLEKVHFHEVGAVDSILDFVSAAWIIEEGKVGGESIAAWSVGAIPAGHGSVDTAHGRIPVPVPAVANLLVGFRMEQLPIESELVTPTGAAILSSLKESGLLKQRKENELVSNLMLSSVGYGLGTKDLGNHANAVRMLIYKENDDNNKYAGKNITYESISKLTCEIDDMQPELLAELCNHTFYEYGALDVVRSTVVMKKGRLGTQIQILCNDSDKDKVVELVLKRTSTLGVRIERVERAILSRKIVTIKTRLGEVEVKVSGEGTEIKVAPEFDSVVELARKCNVNLLEAWRVVIAAIDKVYFT